jgi:crotonobetainyl-CoA:carnitine CoA-transferase CaiB-like acyl-CoA transferase
MGALTGLKILDLSRLLPGPFCSMLLADLGAEVIKVEDPKLGDYIRWWPPKVGRNSGFHVVLNRNKQSLSLNLKAQEGKEIFRRMAKDADVVLEGFRPGVMRKLGLDHEALQEINPRLVYCAITGYGSEGAMALRAGHDINYLARNGVLSYSGRDGVPCMTGVQIADLGGGGLLAAFSIMAAIYARERSGEGQFVDISMTDGAMTWNCLRWGKFLGDGKSPAPGDDMLNHGFACYNIYETRDGRFMSLGALEPQFWKAFCLAVGRTDGERTDYFEPGEHQVGLTQELASLFKKKTQAEWVECFQKVDCCCEPVMSLDEVVHDPEANARGMVVELMHESWGAYRQLGIAPKFSKTPGTLQSHAPELGEHTREILGNLGINGELFEDLRSRGVI